MCLFDRFVLLSLLCLFDRLRLDYLVVPFVQWCRFARYYQLDQLLPMGLGIRLRPLYLLCQWCRLYRLSLEDPLRRLCLLCR